MIRLSNMPSEFYENEKNPITTFPAKNFQNFTKSIFSLGGMIESNRITTPSLAQCTNYSNQYTLKQPYELAEEEDEDNPFKKKKNKYYPSNTNGDRFRCNSEVDSVEASRTVFDTHVKEIPETTTFPEKDRNDTIPVRPDENFFMEVKRYDGNTKCLVGTLTIDGKKFENNKKCPLISLPGSG